MGYFRYWCSVCCRALREAWTWVFGNWILALLSFVISGAVSLLAISRYGTPTDISAQLLVLFSACVGTALTFFVVVVIKLFGVPSDMHCEQDAKIKKLTSQIANTEALSAPRIEVLGLEQPPGDPSNAYYLRVQNLGKTKSLTGCLARIEQLTDSDGVEHLSFWVLRTENQVGGRPEGRFNMDPSQVKRVLLCNRSGTSGMPFQILAAQNKSKKLSTGNYAIDIRITSSEGGSPTDVVVRINGSDIRFEGNKIGSEDN